VKCARIFARKAGEPLVLRIEFANQKNNGRTEMADKIDLNSAGPEILTQLPGVSKPIAYKIVEHRKRRGSFTAWEELLGVAGFPQERLDEVKEVAILGCPDDRPGEQQTACTPPRHLNPDKIEQDRGAGYNRKLRSTRGIDRSKESNHPRAA
jgi:Helix-hairpin-helix motif